MEATLSMRIREIVFKRGAFLMMVALLLGYAPVAHATTPSNLVIYEVAGAGGLSGASYRQDTIILFNPSQSPITCTACAIQYHSNTASTSTKWTVYKLPSLSIASGGYYMIAGSAVTLSSYGSVAPIPYDYQLGTIEGTATATQNILSSVAGVIALTNTQTALTSTASIPCGTGSQLLDVVGYGSNIATNSATKPTVGVCYQGSGSANYDGSSQYGFQMSAARQNPCINTGNNLADFVNVPIFFLNSGSNPTPCPTGNQLQLEANTITATPTNPYPGGAVTFTAKVDPATQPSSSGITVNLDFNAPYYGGSALQMYDDGTHGDAVPNDNIYTLATTLPAGVPTGYTYSANITVTDAFGNTYTGSTPLTVVTAPPPPPTIALTLYEVAGAGGLSDANYRQDTIILFNPSSSTVNCTTCAIQTYSGSGSTAAWTVYQLPGLSIPAGGYYMIAASSSTLSNNGSLAAIPYDYRLKALEGTALDGPVGDDLLSPSVGVVALTSSQVALTASSSALCGTASQLVDLVGYGSTTSTNASTSPTPSSCYEGSGEATYDGSAQYGYRMGITRANPCVNTANNASDWVNVPVVYLNSASTPTACPAGTQLSAVVSATPSSPNPGGPVTFTATVTPATQPFSSGITVNLDLNSPYYGGSAMQMYDDGTHGDAVAGDGTYTLATSIPSGVVAGFTYPTNVTVTDVAGDTFTGGSTPITISASSANNSIRIIAWYGAGNLSKSMYGRDTVILFNPYSGPITMNNWSLQTGGTTGSFTTIYKLPVVTLPAGGFYALVGSGVNYISSSGCTSSICNLNYPYDYQLKTIEGTVTNTDNDLSSTAVTVALVNNQTALSGTCPLTSPNLVDLVGVGAADGSSPVTCYAGSNYATYTPSTTNGAATNINGIVYAYATVRKNKCGNTFDNANDFMLGYINFSNSTTKPDPCPLGTQMAVAPPTATPNSLGVLDPFTITAKITPATNPNSTSLNVTADLSNLGLSSASQLYDDGTHGDAVAGDKIYSLATASTSGPIGPVTGLIVTATDAQGGSAQNLIPLTIEPGTISMTTPNASGTVTAGGVLTFPITITGQRGYGGILNITCEGTPNTNSLGVPVSTQCVLTPPELTLSPDGSSTISVAIATGTTKSASVASSSLPLGLISLLSIGAMTVGLWRRKHLPSAVLLALVTLLTLNTTACGKNAGLGNTAVAPGTYTYTITATDSAVTTITNSLTFTVTVQ